MAANISALGNVRVLSRPPQASKPFEDSDMQDPPTLARILLDLVRAIAALNSGWKPDRIDFEDRTVLGDGTTLYRFSHGYGGRVRYWPVEWSGAAAPNLVRHVDTDDNTLVLTSTSAGEMTLRIEQAG